MLKKYKCPIYKQTVTFMYTDSLQEIIDWVKLEMTPADRHDIALRLENSDAFCMRYKSLDNSSYKYVLCICSLKYSESLLVHELTHLVHFMFDELEVPLSYDTKEVYGYHMQYWHERLSHFKRKIIKRTNGSN